MKIDIQKIISDYKEDKNIWRVGLKNNLSGQYVHEVLKKNNIDTSSKNKWTENQINELKDIYNSGFKSGDNILNLFCKKHNKLKSNVCRKAKLLNLNIDSKRKSNVDLIQRQSEKCKLWIRENGHPRGMLGKHHTEENKKKYSYNSKEMWKNSLSFVNSDIYRDNLSDRMLEQMSKRMKDNPMSIYSRTKRGFVTIEEKTFFARSTWEANVASYFQFLKENGDIKDWVHEPYSFIFKEIKRGVRSYLPDFKIIKNDNSFYYVEVKGWMDYKSKLKMERMSKYYPNIKIEIIDETEYLKISSKKNLFNNWGLINEKTVG